MKKVGVCGHFGKNQINGQTIKTKEVTKELVKQLGRDQVMKVDTSEWRHKPHILIFNLIKLLRKCENIVVFPAHNGVRVFIPLLSILNYFSKRRLHYVVIGGWLPEMVDIKKYLKPHLRRFEKIYVETNILKVKLLMKGLSNVEVMPNFKASDPSSIVEANLNLEKPYQFCFFARVIPDKGIEDAIDAIHVVNSKAKEKVCHLDVFGPINEEYRLRLNEIISSSNEDVEYKGVLSPQKTGTVLQKYYMQIFPTKFYTEGLPGSIIDSYFAGLPVLASKWESFHDVIVEGETGVGYAFNDSIALLRKLEWVIQNPDKIYQMRQKCQTKALQYSSDVVSKILIANLK